MNRFQATQQLQNLLFKIFNLSSALLSKLQLRSGGKTQKEHRLIAKQYKQISIKQLPIIAQKFGRL
jgi:hypothetical protein